MATESQRFTQYIVIQSRDSTLDDSPEALENQRSHIKNMKCCNGIFIAGEERAHGEMLDSTDLVNSGTQELAVRVDNKKKTSKNL